MRLNPDALRGSPFALPLWNTLPCAENVGFQSDSSAKTVSPWDASPLSFRRMRRRPLPCLLLRHWRAAIARRGAQVGAFYRREFPANGTKSAPLSSFIIFIKTTATWSSP